MQSNRLMLIVAVVAGVVATVLAFLYIGSKTRAIEADTGEPTVDILFALNDLSANHSLIPEEDLHARPVGEMSSPGLVAAAVKADELESVRGKFINMPIAAGGPLLYSHLASIDDIELEPGMRAIGVNVDEQATLGGILIPGDRVDILVSYKLVDPVETEAMPAADPNDPMSLVGAMMGQFVKESMAPDKWQVDTILEDIRVLAINDRLNLSRQQHLFGMDTGMEGREGLGGSSVVTLEVTPEQARALLRAQAGGGNPLRFLLRPAVGPEDGAIGGGG
ncbi:MAG: Flp pilus assembly protein CpaB [Planctomycetota bacterium JB042]